MITRPEPIFTIFGKRYSNNLSF